jgi:hypothetical protein
MCHFVFTHVQFFNAQRVRIGWGTVWLPLKTSYSILSVCIILNSLTCNSFQHRELAYERERLSASEIFVLLSVCVILNSLVCNSSQHRELVIPP